MVAKKNGFVIMFEYQTLTSSESLEEWGALAAAAFAFKGGDPRRFRWNYDADPNSTPADVHVRVSWLVPDLTP